MTEPITLTAALLAGLLGSGHCLGMCGPIAILPGSSSTGKLFNPAAIYNLGRLLSYATVGGLVGGMASALGNVATITQWALFMRIGIGMVLLLVGLQLIFPGLRLNPLQKLGSGFWRHIAPIARRLKASKKTSHLFALGLLWGWLPCGLVYSMLALATVSGSSFNGAATMLAFGIGTLPAMMGLGIAGFKLHTLHQPKMRRVFGGVLIIGGLWTAALPMQHVWMSDHTHHHASWQSNTIHRNVVTPI